MRVYCLFLNRGLSTIAAMSKHDDVLSLIGNTPLVRLNRVSELTGCEIWGKAEFLNPGQSIKDRAALFIVRDAVEKGQLHAGGTIVEGTAGNTGIGLSLVANAMGFKSVIVIPETQSQEKKDALTLFGAELIQVPAKPYKNPNNYVKLSGRLAARLDAELLVRPNSTSEMREIDRPVRSATSRRCQPRLFRASASCLPKRAA